MQTAICQKKMVKCMSESEQLHEMSDEINAQINLVELKTVVTPTRALLWVAGTTCDPKLCSVKIESYQNKLCDANEQPR